MTKGNQDKKVHPSYKAMLDSVVEFVEKEGKSLQEAFIAAEKKLETTAEHSKTNIKQASDSLKMSLVAFGEAMKGVSEAYKERIEFDTAYVKTSVWSTLKSLANNNTAQLIEFTRQLKESAHAANYESHFSAHNEHTLWDSEHQLWLDEIDFWLKEHEQATRMLNEVKLVLGECAASLIEHKNIILAHQELEQVHEKAMKNAEQDDTSEVYSKQDDKQSKVHEQESTIHAEQAKQHQLLKAHHLKTISMINLLHKEMHK